MQIMPETAMDPGYGMPSVFDLSRELGFDPIYEDEPTARELLKDPEVNRVFGERYMRRMLERFGGDLNRALAAYNWGPGNAIKWSGRMEDLPKETREYIRRVLNTMQGPAPLTSPAPRPRPEGLAVPVSDAGDKARQFLIDRLLGDDTRGIAQVARMAAQRAAG
jgi:soluble lytic murein transglycosylase-like protein